MEANKRKLKPTIDPEPKFTGTWPSGKCTRCGEKSEMYYVQYCPKCDIQDIIKHKRGAVCLMPILKYGERYIPGFNKDTIWNNLCDTSNFSNDSYLDYCIEEADDMEPGDRMLKNALDALGVEPDMSGGDPDYLFWISW